MVRHATPDSEIGRLGNAKSPNLTFEQTSQYTTKITNVGPGPVMIKNVTINNREECMSRDPVILQRIFAELTGVSPLEAQFAQQFLKPYSLDLPTTAQQTQFPATMLTGEYIVVIRTCTGDTVRVAVDTDDWTISWPKRN